MAKLMKVSPVENNLSLKKSMPCHQLAKVAGNDLHEEVVNQRRPRFAASYIP